MSKSKNELIVAAATTVTPVQEAISKPTIQDFADQIDQTCQETVDGILKTANICSEAMEAWPEGQTDLVSLLKYMDEATFSRYRAIGDDKRLLAIKSDLPPHYSTIYELTKLKGGSLNEAHATGEITPKLLRKQAENLVESYFPKKRRKRTNKSAEVTTASAPPTLPKLPSPPTAPGGGPISIVVDWGYEMHQSQDFYDWLKEGIRKYNVEVLNWDDAPQFGSIYVDQDFSSGESE